MKKPADFDNVQAFGEFEPLELGGHVCKIMSVEESKSRAGKDMLIISLDIAEGKQANYYANQYKNDTRDNKKWGCIVYTMVYDQDGATSRGFKTFIDIVEKSNKGFITQWGDSFGDQFKGKLIGGVFGREEYINNNGEKKFATKCMFFRTVEAVRKGIEAPADKLLQGSSAGFAQTSQEDDDDLPF